MKKRLLGILLTVAMSASALTGFSVTAQAAEEIDLEDTESSTGNTVTIWTWDYDNTLKMADAFNKVYPNIEIEVVNVAYSDYTQRSSRQLLPVPSFRTLLHSPVPF